MQGHGVLCTDFLPAERLSPVKGVIFDCDGVLIDSLEANAAYYNLYRAHFGLPPLSAKEKRFVHSASVDVALQSILPQHTWDEAFKYREELDYKLVLPALKLEEGLVELLQTLRAQEYVLGICTNRMGTMRMLLSHFGLASYFDRVVQAKDVSLAKPHPEGLHVIMSAWKMKPRDVIFIGDSWVDEATAQAAAVPFWAYKNPALSAAVHLPDFPSLTRCLKRSERRERGC